MAIPYDILYYEISKHLCIKDAFHLVLPLGQFYYQDLCNKRKNEILTRMRWCQTDFLIDDCYHFNTHIYRIALVNSLFVVLEDIINSKSIIRFCKLAQTKPNFDIIVLNHLHLHRLTVSKQLDLLLVV